MPAHSESHAACHSIRHCCNVLVHSARPRLLFSFVGFRFGRFACGRCPCSMPSIAQNDQFVSFGKTRNVANGRFFYCRTFRFCSLMALFECLLRKNRDDAVADKVLVLGSARWLFPFARIMMHAVWPLEHSLQSYALHLMAVVLVLVIVVASFHSNGMAHNPNGILIIIFFYDRRWQFSVGLVRFE